MTIYDPELLRTFLAVTQSLNFTAAGVSRGISQPTVSQQVRRLEEAVGRPLVVRDTRSVSLTADGEALAGFAKEILAAHDRAAGYFTGLNVSGRLRFGVTDDLALTPLPRILREFRRLHPQINLELTVLQNESLVRRLESGYVDVAFVKRSTGAPATNPGELVRRDQLVWVTAEGERLKPDQPVPLVVYSTPSLSRAVSVRALEEAGRSNRITCTVRGVNGVLAAVRAGLGIAVLARTLVPSDLIEVPAAARLPKLPHVDLVLLTHDRAPAEPARALMSAILGSGVPLKPNGSA